MKSRVKRLPGCNCAHYRQGRCLYGERLNPGYNRDWRCRVLLHWEEAYDSFITQADAFSLEADMASRIWEGRMRRFVKEAGECVDFIPGDDELTGCALNIGGLCLKRLPPCEGQCANFVPRGGPPDSGRCG